MCIFSLCSGFVLKLSPCSVKIQSNKEVLDTLSADSLCWHQMEKAQRRLLIKVHTDKGAHTHRLTQIHTDKRALTETAYALSIYLEREPIIR